mgnify:CR=1 FL=1
MSNWEYTYVIAEVQAKNFIEGCNILLGELNELGSQGWEICSASEIAGTNWSGNITARSNLILLKRAL